MPNHVTSVSLPAEILHRLTEQTRREDRPKSWLIRDALISYLAQSAEGGTEAEAPPGESSDLPFDKGLSLQIDQITLLIEAETNEFWRRVLTCYRERLERGIWNEN